MDEFQQEVEIRIKANAENNELRSAADAFMYASTGPKYSYNFSWLGRPIIQYPQDIVAMQELIWQVQPDLIIETGIARGGSLVFSASMLALLDMCNGVVDGAASVLAASKRRVLGVDIEIRQANKLAILGHPLASLIHMIEGPSTSGAVLQQVRDYASDFKKVLVCLDSNHTHDHVLDELRSYAPFTSPNSYCVVFDTVIEDLPEGTYPDRPWGVGNSPRTAVNAYLLENPDFKQDSSIENKLMITVARGGYLKRTATK